MPNSKVKIGLYFISLSLLFVLLFINKVDVPVCFGEGCEFIGGWKLLERNVIPLICLGLILVATYFYFHFRFKYEKGAPDLPWEITSLENLEFENASFLITYIVPLLCFDLDFDLSKNRNLLMLFLVLGLIGWIFVKTHSFYTNPTLAIFGYRIYRLNTLKFENRIAIAKGELKVGDAVYPHLIEQNIYYVAKEKRVNDKRGAN